MPRLDRGINSYFCLGALKTLAGCTRGVSDQLLLLLLCHNTAMLSVCTISTLIGRSHPYEYSYQGSVLLKCVQMPDIRIRSNARRHDILFFVILRNEVTKNPMGSGVSVGRWILHRYAVQNDPNVGSVQSLLLRLSPIFAMLPVCTISTLIGRSHPYEYSGRVRVSGICFT